MNGKKPFIIPIFIPHLGCFHRCIYCNQSSITGVHFDPDKIHDIVSKGVASPKKKGKITQVAFYGGNLPSLPLSVQRDLLARVRPFLEDGTVDSLRISARPDVLTDLELEFLKENGVATIEIGAQSLNAQVLKCAERGHTPEQVYEAAASTRAYGFELGIQLMVGLPCDDREGALRTARETITMAPDFVRIYPTVVLRKSKLAHLYQEGAYQPLSVEEAVSICADMAALFQEACIRIIRIGLQDSNTLSGSGELIAGPHHPALGHMVKSELSLRKTMRQIQALDIQPQVLVMRVSPNEISAAKGHENRNLERIKQAFGFRTFSILGDNTLKPGEVAFDG